MTTVRRVPILMYHSIATESDPRFRRWMVLPAHFAAQMQFLHDEGYTPLTVTQYVASVWGATGSLPARPVVLTFDDGFADFATAALPALAAHAFVATLYLTTGYIGDTSTWLAREGEADRRMLTWQEVREIAAMGIECGAHTHTHPALDTLPLDAAGEEIVRPRALIEAQTGASVTTFAYPFGYDSAALRAAVRAAGYTSACAVRYRPSSPADDPFALSRLIVTADTTLADFAALVTGTAVPLSRTVERTRAFAWQRVRRFRAALGAALPGRAA